LVLVGLFSGCDQKTERAHFYPIDSLVKNQKLNLTKNQAILYKYAILQQGIDTIIYTPKDTIEWGEELDIFGDLDVINKPVNKGLYLDTLLYDPGSNLTVKAFTTTKDLPVKSLRIFYDRSDRIPRKIEAEHQEVNFLFSTYRTLSMEFQQIDDQTVLTSYTISGGQKMILGDSISFSVRGRIQVD
jgi:hypothetical protein